MENRSYFLFYQQAVNKYIYDTTADFLFLCQILLMTIQNIGQVSHDEAVLFRNSDPWLQLHFKLRNTRYPVQLFPDFDDNERKIIMKVYSFRLYCPFSDGNVFLRLNALWFDQDIIKDGYVWHPLRPFANAMALKNILVRKYSLKELVKLNQDNKSTVNWQPEVEDFTMHQFVSHEKES